jgi:hypothetical protein
LFGPSTKGVDGRVVKAVLLNSADKIAGWNNGQMVTGSGVIFTTQSLDYASGTGAMNLNRAFDQLTAGTTDVPGLGGGPVQTIGWDYGRVHFDGVSDYPITSQLLAGSTLSVTLDWFVSRTIDLSTNATQENIFNDLDLQVWKAVGGVATTLVASSNSQYNNVEHLYFQLSTDDFYLLRVVFTGNNWNFSGEPTSNLDEDFGLAWDDIPVVPEPSSLVLLLTGAGTFLLVHRRRKR